jgi:signal transduction histidine kinase
MERRVKAEDPLHLPVSSIVREALRCKGLVRELLTFARAAKKTFEPVQLNSLVKDSSVLLESRAKTQAVRVEHELTEVPVVVANQSQLQQIIVNLGTNALDAMADGGVLTLRTRALGSSACLEVADTGTGIPPDIRERIFDPFFTTKDPGKGTGLGLSLVHEIVQQHGGSIVVESQAGKGTTMCVLLPAGDPRAARAVSP